MMLLNGIRSFMCSTNFQTIVTIKEKQKRFLSSLCIYFAFDHVISTLSLSLSLHLLHLIASFEGWGPYILRQT